MSGEIKTPLIPWKEYEKFIFRLVFAFFFIQAVPLDWDYFREIFSVNWSHLQYGDIFNLTRYAPKFYVNEESFYNWGIVFLIALLSAVIWTTVDNKNKEYNLLYYWLRVIVRYRLAIGLLGYGFLKLFPLQAPYPSISNLNTHYGDYSNWKIFSLSLGIVPGYESFLGLVEIGAALLLLYRKTATIGAFMVLLFTGNVFMSNLAYEGGEYIYSLYLISFALFLLFFDVQRLYVLFGQEKGVLPNRFRPFYPEAWQRGGRLALKGFIAFFFVFLYGFKTYSGAREDSYQFPKQAGLKDAAGIYDVAEFKINNQLLPYSATDSIRWKDVVFEKWATISIRSNRPVQLQHASVEQIASKDEDRIYELSGSAGRHYYSYQINKQKNQLLLKNKNKNYAGEKLLLQFSKTTNDQIILNGVNERNDSIYVVLNRIPKKYLLKEAEEGRGKPIKL